MVRDTLKQLFLSALSAAQESGALPAFPPLGFDVLRPKQADHGDYSCNVAMVAAAAARKEGANVNPRQVAQAIVDHMPANELISTLEIAGPGFINVRLADGWLQQQPAAIVAAGERFGNNDRGRGRRWQVEFVSANPTGPIHYGGARNAVLGDAVSNVLAASGYEVQREYYVNDGGSQFVAFIDTLYARYMQALGHDVPLPEKGYAGDYMVEYARTILQEHGEGFASLPREEAIAALRPIGRELVVSRLRAELGRINVHFDNWFSEQSLYDEGLIEQALKEMDARGELYERDGAIWFRASDYPGIEKDEVVVRSSGAPTYLAGDIAYHYDKFVRRGFDQVVNVWSVDHQGHVARMRAVVQSLGIAPDRLTILLYDLVKLVRDGTEVKLSKRAGNLVTINDVVDEVGSDALHFNLLSRAPESVIEFDLDLAVAQNNENPVYYVQYSHARICSILGKARDEGFDASPDAAADATLIVHTSELALIRKLLELEEQVDFAAERLAPHVLVHFAVELARSFNAFYRDCYVVDVDNQPQSQARLLLCHAAATGLRKVLSLLGVSAPESM
jgi:arginyl-tRNA synthetase